MDEIVKNKNFYRLEETTNTRPFWVGFLQVFILTFLAREDFTTVQYKVKLRENENNQQLSQQILNLKMGFETILSNKAILNELTTHAVFSLKMKSVYECLSGDFESFNYGSFLLRYISFKAVFAREEEFFSPKTKQTLTHLLNQSEILKTALHEYAPEGLKTPKARGSASVYDETRAYLQDMMHYHRRVKAQGHE